MRRVRIEHDGAPAWGELRGGEVVLDSGVAVDAEGVRWLAPVEPSKIVAVHLTYRSRLVEYEAREPSEPSYFLKPPSSLNGHLGVIRRPRGARLRGGRAGRARLCVWLCACQRCRFA
jgi:5-oxopent-3-ene-1,2,5-tricarboxylate decarboxylase / 2-hydroxyhepta-2,4-diene-1,7-dioate isomerase